MRGQGSKGAVEMLEHGPDVIFAFIDNCQRSYTFNSSICQLRFTGKWKEISVLDFVDFTGVKLGRIFEKKKGEMRYEM